MGEQTKGRGNCLVATVSGVTAVPWVPEGTDYFGEHEGELETRTDTV